MIQNLEDLKAFILWCRSQGVEAVQIGEVRVKLRQRTVAIAERAAAATTEAEVPKRPASDLEEFDEDEIFWSSN